MKLKGYVHIVESPSANDLLDGRTEGRLLSEALQLAGIPYQYNLATNSSTFERCFRERLLTGMQAHQSHPMFHLSMHGNRDGVALTDKSFLDWAALRRIIAPVSNATTNGLLLCMSTCHGAEAKRIAVETVDEVKLWALVGPLAEASWSDSAIAYTAFYHRFFKGASIEDAVAAMRAAAGTETFTLIHGEHLRESWRSFAAQGWTQFLEMLERAGVGKPNGGAA